MKKLVNFLKQHSKLILGIGAEKFFLIGGVLMTWRGITGHMMGHRLSPRERFCYLICGISDHLSFIVPIFLHHQQLRNIFQQFTWTFDFWQTFGKEIIYMSIRYFIFTKISRIFYGLSKPTQIKKARNHFKN